MGEWIFEKHAEGWPAIKIVTELNRLNVPSPGTAYKKRSYHGKPSWNFLAIHGELDRGTDLLNRHLYLGVYRWNRSYRVADPDPGPDGKHKQENRWRDKSEWIERSSRDELRIVSGELWNKAHERRVAVRSYAAVRPQRL